MNAPRQKDAPDFATALLGAIQARHKVAALKEVYDDIGTRRLRRHMQVDRARAAGASADELAEIERCMADVASGERAENRAIFEGAWAVYQASWPYPVRQEFPALFGVEFSQFEHWIIAVGESLWEDAPAPAQDFAIISPDTLGPFDDEEAGDE